MFRTKICGVRLEKDLQTVERSGGDAVGFNFFAKSIRFLDPIDAATRRLSESAAALGLLRVGVFVNESLDSIRWTVDRVGLDAVQLHGDEAPDLGHVLRSLDYRVVRAIKLPKSAFEAAIVEDKSKPWVAMGCHLLLDVDAGASHGGSGKTLDWASVARWSQSHPSVAWTLAGGLKPENVAQAIQATGAVSVDTASGVECPKGVKSAERIQAFLAAARG